MIRRAIFQRSRLSQRQRGLLFPVSSRQLRTRALNAPLRGSFQPLPPFATTAFGKGITADEKRNRYWQQTPLPTTNVASAFLSTGHDEDCSDDHLLDVDSGRGSSDKDGAEAKARLLLMDRHTEGRKEGASLDPETVRDANWVIRNLSKVGGQTDYRKEVERVQMCYDILMTRILVPDRIGRVVLSDSDLDAVVAMCLQTTHKLASVARTQSVIFDSTDGTQNPVFLQHATKAEAIWKTLSLATLRNHSPAPDVLNSRRNEMEKAFNTMLNAWAGTAYAAVAAGQKEVHHNAIAEMFDAARDAAHRAESLLMELATSTSQQETLDSRDTVIELYRLHPNNVSFNTVMKAWSETCVVVAPEKEKKDEALWNTNHDLEVATDDHPMDAQSVENTQNVTSFDAADHTFALSGAKRTEAILTLLEELADTPSSHHSLVPSERSYNAAITAWVRSTQPLATKSAKAVLERMIRRYREARNSNETQPNPSMPPAPSIRTYTLLMNAFLAAAKVSATDDIVCYAEELLKEVWELSTEFSTEAVEEDGTEFPANRPPPPNTILYNSLISILLLMTKREHGLEARRNCERIDALIEEMIATSESFPDVITLASAADAWSFLSRAERDPSERLEYAQRAEWYLRKLFEYGEQQDEQRTGDGPFIRVYNDLPGLRRRSLKGVIGAYIRGGAPRHAEELLRHVVDSYSKGFVKPDFETHERLVRAFADLALSCRGKPKWNPQDLDRYGIAQSDLASLAVDQAEHQLMDLERKYEEGIVPSRPDTKLYNLIIEARIRVYQEEKRILGERDQLDIYSFDAAFPHLSHAHRFLDEMTRQHEANRDNIETSFHDIRAKPNFYSFEAVIDGYKTVVYLVKVEEKLRIIKKMFDLVLKMEELDELQQERKEKYGEDSLEYKKTAQVSPEASTYNIILDAYRNTLFHNKFTENVLSMEQVDRIISIGEKILERMATRETADNGSFPNRQTTSFVMKLYADSGVADAGSRALQTMERLLQFCRKKSVNPDEVVDIVAYNSLFAALARSTEDGSAERAERLLKNLEQMAAGGKPELKPDVTTYTTVMMAWAREGTAEAAQRAAALLHSFEKASASAPKNSAYIPDSRCYNALIDALARCGTLRAALKSEEIVDHMANNRISPDSSTYNLIMKQWAALAQRRDIDARTEKGMTAAERVEELLYMLIDAARSQETDPEMFPENFHFKLAFDMLRITPSRDSAERAEEILREKEDICVRGRLLKRRPFFRKKAVVTHLVVSDYNDVLKIWESVAVSASSAEERELAASRSVELLRKLMEHDENLIKPLPNGATFRYVLSALDACLSKTEAIDGASGGSDVARMNILRDAREDVRNLVAAKTAERSRQEGNRPRKDARRW